MATLNCTIELVGGPFDGVCLTLPPMVGEFRINWIMPPTETMTEQQYTLVYQWDGRLIDWERKRFVYRYQQATLENAWGLPRKDSQ